LFTESAVVVARCGHPLGQRRHVVASELTHQTWVLPRQRELERLAFEDFFLAHQLTPPRAQIETTSTALMKSLVMQSDALTFIPQELIHWEAQAGQLMALPVAGTDWARRVGITRRRSGSRSAACISLQASLKAVAQRHFA
jgi:LysR family transcriptional regulator of gallate degradation